MPASDSIHLPEFVTSPVIVVLVGWYLFLSCLAFLVFAHDKRAARTQRSRVPERRLHLLELLGGFPGAWLAIFMFHHKSSKGSFLVVYGPRFGGEPARSLRGLEGRRRRFLSPLDAQCPMKERPPHSFEHGGRAFLVGDPVVEVVPILWSDHSNPTVSRPLMPSRVRTPNEVCSSGKPWLAPSK